MKHIILLSTIILSSVIAFGQWTDQGATMYTADRIQQSSKIYFPYSNGNNYIRASSTSTFTFFDSQAGVGVGHQSTGVLYPFSVLGKSFLYGDVRIGGTAITNGLPSARLHVYGNAGSLLLEGTDHVFMSFYPDGYGAGRKAYFGYPSSSSNTMTMKNEISGADVEISVTDSGAINLIGNVWAKKVVVQLTDPWPDYVFSKNYKLRTIYEVEQFISDNQHLPSVPSAQEIKEGGINLGEMDAVLLQKIEELTLYTIEQQKQLDELKNMVELHRKSLSNR